MGVRGKGSWILHTIKRIGRFQDDLLLSLVFSFHGQIDTGEEKG